MNKFIAGLLAVIFGAALVRADGINIPFSFPASACTNQFIRSIAASTGVGTCASIAAGDFPTLTGDVTTAGGSLATTLAAGSASNLNSGTLAAARGGTGVSNSFNTTVTSAVSIGKGQYVGTATNDNATAGNIGELIDSTVLTGAAVSLTTATPTNVTSVSLTAGDWNCWANEIYNAGGTTVVLNTILSMGTTTTALATAPNGGGYALNNFPGGITGSAGTSMFGMLRVSVGSTTTLYLVGYGTFSVSTLSVYGYLGCRRVR